MHLARSALLVLCTLPGCAAPSSAPSDRSAVLATVQAFFDAMHARDPEAAARTVVPDGVFVNTRVENELRVERHFSNREWIEKLPSEKTVLLEEFTATPEVLVEGDLATVWCAYRFSIDQKPSHTGVDLFNLVRTAQGWRISGGAYSVVRPPAPAR
jgi:ketosteroid isomerase-like protein